MLLLFYLSHFNSIKVRLEPTGFYCSFYEGCYFNSIKVRLERLPRFRLPTFASNFNSIKVRLERSRPGSSYRRPRFQFHKGAIRTFRHRSKSTRFRYFNSIKVRLEPKGGSASAPNLKFQFHKGAIRTGGGRG